LNANVPPKEKVTQNVKVTPRLRLYFFKPSVTVTFAILKAPEAPEPRQRDRYAGLPREKPKPHELNHGQPPRNRYTKPPEALRYSINRYAEPHSHLGSGHTRDLNQSKMPIFSPRVVKSTILDLESEKNAYPYQEISRIGSFPNPQSLSGIEIRNLRDGFPTLEDKEAFFLSSRSRIVDFTTL
jgi:hypothetical protein